MIELAGIVIETEQQGGDEFAAGAVAETTDHAVGGAGVFDLAPGPLGEEVRCVEALGDHAIERPANPVEPALRGLHVISGWGQPKQLGRVAGEEPLKRRTAVTERLVA